MRNPNTNRHGAPWGENTENAVWLKAVALQTGRGMDACRAIMHWEQYGNTGSAFGWEVDHIKPVAAGGGDELENLQALQWENNRHKSDDAHNGFADEPVENRAEGNGKLFEGIAISPPALAVNCF